MLFLGDLFQLPPVYFKGPVYTPYSKTQKIHGMCRHGKLILWRAGYNDISVKTDTTSPTSNSSFIDTSPTSTPSTHKSTLTL